MMVASAIVSAGLGLNAQPRLTSDRCTARLTTVRSTCAWPDCGNKQRRRTSRRADGQRVYDRYCDKHLRTTGGSGQTRTKQRAKGGKDAPCVRCGWREGPCDAHRRKPGADGGRYVKGNVVALCPNCHRLITLGIISDETLGNTNAA